ncbi:MAG: family 16 glycosylhydrolase [Pseudomonadota bacterium]
MTCFQSFKYLYLLSILLVSMAFSGLAPTAVILNDNFPGSITSSTNWYIPTWVSPTDGTFLGQTQFRCSQNSALPPASNNNVTISVQTYNPTGYSFYGTDLISKQLIPLGQGIDIVIRAKVNTTTPGIVAGIFLYALEPGSNTIHDEIDFELLTNTPNYVHTNVYSDEALGVGNPLAVPYAAGNINDYHTYEIIWMPDRVIWLVDGTPIRQETSHVPTGAMNLHLNMWVPGSEWPNAYSPYLYPTSSAGSNQIHSMSVNLINVQSVPSVTVLSNIVLSPLTSYLSVGQNTQQLTAYPLDQDNQLIAANITWKSNNTSVATVNSSGLVTSHWRY